MKRVEKVLELKNISKKFGEFYANKNINLEIGRGQIHALLGENGAGKSTLMSTVFGLHQPDGGEIYVYERQIKIENPNHAIKLGIGMVHQHFKLVEDFTVTENIILGMEPKIGHRINMKSATKEVKDLSEKYGLKVDPNSKVENLAVGVQQKVEILKALYRGANILIFDEPTAVLTPDEIGELLDIMKTLVAEGKSIVLITHKLNEIMSVADKCTVIRRGEYIKTVDIKDTDENELAQLMVGKTISKQLDKNPFNPADKILEINHLHLVSKSGRKILDDVSLTVHGGEVLGIAGVDGNGQSELVESIVNMIETNTGEIKIKGQSTKGKSIRDIFESGVSYVPADRHKHGLVLDKNISENLILIEYYKKQYNDGLNLKKMLIRDEGKQKMQAFDIRAESEATIVRGMSGGNQQKVILAREISRNPELLIIVQPTRGLDIGAINFIHNQIIRLRDQGVAILLVSFELEELLSLSDRINIIFDGKIIGQVDPNNTNDTELGLMMAGKGV
ncbi:ABC transporter ATP-binding protein [Halolactibacillus alkaliphilus]|uniref:ABC transporter ATP-binding protein n=1 Tax=Halolactibacillus alkaliphilus TaxID=442899 RepID=A0A511X0K9_9BACI|nr:ABC transporter ATP-binding protein [Halolactibacillus alkaliphilus]GEN56475.1 ABC transporter ATP-binding protein [Halolactibacillus alkaliphilus]GGN64269.1 ABC transporter ATP-binding protein [Halolactibacillus alkaliphilus]SFO61505.1 nucleoside ABC transporter ATP-binding protein [Halolactibacillus alkaliphilus]